MSAPSVLEQALMGARTAGKKDIKSLNFNQSSYRSVIIIKIIFIENMVSIGSNFHIHLQRKEELTISERTRWTIVKVVSSAHQT
jgi:hypothetical protein